MRYRKYFLKGLSITLGFLTVLFICIYIYISSNKEKIIKKVTAEISRRINGNLNIGAVDISFFKDFPRISVELKDVLITDTLYSIHQHPFLKSANVYARINLVRLISKQSFINGLKIANGSLYLFTDTSGYSNTYLLKPKNESPQSISSSKSNQQELKDITLTNMRLVLDDKKKNKLYDVGINEMILKVNSKDTSILKFSVQSDITLHSLAFNAAAGSFATEKLFQGNFDFRFDNKSRRILINDINIKLSGQPFNITAMFEMAGNAPQFLLKVHTERILFPFAKSLVTEKIGKALSIADVDKPIDVDLDMSGPLNNGLPLIHASWIISNTHLKTPFLDFDNASFKGNYTNEVSPGILRTDPNSMIGVENFEAEWQGFPVTCTKIRILNLQKPLLTCDLHSNFPLSTFNEVMSSSSLDFQSGNCSMNLTYNGPIEKNDNTNSFVNGEISIKNGTLVYLPRSIELKNTNGKILFKNSDVFAQDLQFNVLGSKLVMNGQAKGLLTLINTTPNAARVKWNIYSPSLNLNNFTTLLRPAKKINKTPTKNKLSKLARIIDQVLQDGSLDVDVRTDRLSFKKFTASNLVANLSLIQNEYRLNTVSMDHAGGKMLLTGALETGSPGSNPVKVNASFQNVDVSKLFYAFDNFGQEAITDKNLEGIFSAKISASMTLDNSGKVKPSSLVSIVDFSLKNGGLFNYEPVKKLQIFLFKKRDFDNIRFAELKDRLEVNNEEIKINRMEIQSSVFSMYLEGKYSPKGNTDISIQVPLSNLKKRGIDYIPENTGIIKKAGASIFVRGRPGPDGTIKFKTDLFNKYKRSKEAAEMQK